MAHFVFTDARVEINSVVLSDHVESVSLEYKAELQDDTNMGDTTRQRLGGLKDWTTSINFRQDFAASEVDATLFPLVGVATVIKIRPTSAAISATNPEYVGTGILESYRPIGDTVGNIAAAPVTFQAAGDLARNTA
jgi:hypothetical protein